MTKAKFVDLLKKAFDAGLITKTEYFNYGKMNIDKINSKLITELQYAVKDFEEYEKTINQ